MTNTNTAERVASVLSRMKAQASAHVARWPQYKGRFDRCRLAVARIEIKTKLGVAAKAGEVVLIDEPSTFERMQGSCTFWSMTNKVGTGAGLWAIDWRATDDQIVAALEKAAVR